MSRSHARGPAERPSVTGRPDSVRADVLCAAIAVAAACLVFRGALPYFFAQDDFTGLARARGLLPPLAFPWRWLSGQLYFDVMRPLAGLNPLGYRLVSLAAHAACVALVYRLCRRFTPAPAAMLGAVFFGTHPALFTALYSVSGIGELLATGCGLGALLLATGSGRRAWWALPCFAASLLSKESMLLLPLVTLLPGMRPARGLREGRVPAVTWALALLSLGYLGAFMALDVFGTRAALDASAPYHLRFDGTLVTRLLTYLGWAVQIPLPLVRSFADAPDPGVFVAGAGFGAAWLAGLAAPDLRSRGWLAGGGWFAAALLPVLPLAHHTYHYYLDAPLAGAAVLVAAAAAAAADRFGRRRDPRVLLGGAAIACAALALNGAWLVRKIETYPMTDPELRADPTVDRARIAAHAVTDLRDAALPPRTRLWFWSPASIARQRDAGGDPGAESYWESNVRVALYDGLAVRVFLPQVESTRFVRRFELAADPVRYALYLPDGHVRTGTSAQLDSVLRRNAAGSEAGP